MPNNLFQNIDLDDTKRDWLAIPGIYRNKFGSGYRVPVNALSLLGATPPARFDLSIGNRALTAALACPVLRPSVAISLRSYQKDALTHALSREGSAIWIPPGGGKTLCGLVYIASDPMIFKLVVTRAAARGTWQEEITKWSTWEPVLLTGEKPDEDILHNYGNKIFVTAWETLSYWAPMLLINRDITRIGILIFDEAHVAKASKRADPVVGPDGKTQWVERDNLTSCAAQLSKHSHRRLCLTATPVPNRVRDLWAQADLAEPWAWGGFKSFGLQYCGAHHNGYGYVYDGYSNGQELKARLAFSAFRVTPSVVKQGLPPKQRIIIRVPLDNQDTPAGGFVRDIQQAAKQAKQGDSTRLHEVLLWEAATRKRTVVLGHIIQALRSSQKIVIFTGRHRDCDELGALVVKTCDKLTWQGAKPKIWVAHGGTPPEKRDVIRREYMGDPSIGRSPHPGPCAIIGTGDAWGESLNLQDTDAAFFVMLPWTPKQLEQWEGRFQRLGGTRPVVINYIVAEDTVDDDVADLLMDKLPAVEAIVTESAIAGISEQFHPVETESLLARITAIAIANGGSHE